MIAWRMKQGKRDLVEAIILDRLRGFAGSLCFTNWHSREIGTARPEAQIAMTGLFNHVPFAKWLTGLLLERVCNTLS